ncbi:MAG: DMT family transporter, partial [Pseudomonadota bacterium]
LAPAVFLCLWSGGYVVAKIALLYSEPMTVLALRYSLVIVIMAFLFLFFRPPLPKTLPEWGHLAMVGFLIQTVYFGMCYLAFRAGSSAGMVALVMSFQPILVGLIAPGWTGEKIGRYTWIGLGLGLIGAVLVIYARSNIETPSLLALGCVTLALFGISAGSLWEKRFGLVHHPITSNLIGYSAGLLGILPFMFWLESMTVDWNWEFAAAMAYLVIGNSVIAIGLLLAMIRAGEVSKVSALFFLVPPMVAVLAWVILDELMPPLAWFGMAIASVGVLLATRTHE